MNKIVKVKIIEVNNVLHRNNGETVVTQHDTSINESGTGIVDWLRAYVATHHNISIVDFALHSLI